MFHNKYTKILSKGLILLAWVLIGGTHCRSQVFEDEYFRSKAAEAMDLMYQQRHEEAEDRLELLQSSYAEHPATYFLMATNRWWQSYISTTPYYHAYIDEQLDKALELNKALKKNESLGIEYTFFEYMCRAFHTRLHTLRREWVRAANEGRKALPLVKECLEYAKKSPEFYFSAGIYHYYAEAYPQEHPYLKPLMKLFPDGSAKVGLREMEKSAAIPNFTQVESIYYLTDVYIFWKKDYQKAIDNIYSLHARYPSNTWFFAEYARALVFGGRYDKVLPHLEKVIGLFEGLPASAGRHVASTESPLTSKLMIRLYHYQGKALLLGEKDLGGAIKAFKKSLRQAELCKIPAYEYIPADYLYLGHCYDRLGLRGMAENYYQKVLEADDNDLYEKRAQDCLSAPCYR